MKPLTVSIVSALLPAWNAGRSPAGAGSPRFRPVCAWLALALLTPLAPALAQSPLGFPDIRAIADRGTLRIGLVTRDNPPLLLTGENGQPAGIEVEVARGLARRLGVKAELVRTAATHDELVWQVATGSVDIALSWISRTADRAQIVRFSRPYLTESMTMLLNRKRALREGVGCPASPSDAGAMAVRPHTVGVIRGTAYESVLRRLHEKAAPDEFDDPGKLLRVLEEEALLAAYASEVAVRHMLATRPAARIRLKLCFVGAQKDRIAIAVRPDGQNLAAWIDVVLENSGLHFEPGELFKLPSDWRF